MSFATAATGPNYRVAGRPRGRLGESGERVLGVITELVIDGVCMDGVTWRDVFAKACMSRAMAQGTIKNLARAGHIEAVGTRRIEGATKPVRVFVPAVQPYMIAGGGAALGAVMFTMCGSVPEACNDE